MAEKGFSEFFLVSLPGLEEIVQKEVFDWFPAWETQLQHGGITVFAPLDQGLQMNAVLKTPTRILIRLGSFMCRDFPKLFKKISTFPWENWISTESLLNTELEIRASSAKSRLKIKKRIEETALEGWKEYQKKTLKIAKPNQKSQHQHRQQMILFVRLHDNLCTLSLDTSGELLHKRGMRTHIGDAPLRETIASALIQWLGQSGDFKSKDIEIIDPMMGSGTFLLEAAIQDLALGKQKIDIAPPKGRPRITHFVGYEKDQKTIKAAEKNLSFLGLAKDSVQIFKEDFFLAQTLPHNQRIRWVICNPPYGVRLKVKEPLSDFYARLFQQTFNIFSPDRACFIIPKEGVKGRLNLPGDWKVLSKRPFSNGGILVNAYIFAPAARP